MATIQARAISWPEKTFKCRVLRPDCYNVLHTPPRWEEWDVLAETIEGARQVAEYHFYMSNPENIIIESLAINNVQLHKE